MRGMEGMTDMLRKGNAELKATVSQRDMMLKNNEKDTRNQINNLNRKAGKLRIKYEESQDDCNILAKEFQESQDQRNSLTTEIKKNCVELQSLKAKYEGLEKASQELMEDRNLLSVEWQQSQDMCEELRREIKENGSDCFMHSYDLQLSNAKYRDLENRFNLEQAKCGRLQKIIKEKDTSFDYLKEENQEAENNSSFNSELLQQRNEQLNNRCNTLVGILLIFTPLASLNFFTAVVYLALILTILYRFTGWNLLAYIGRRVIQQFQSLLVRLGYGSNSVVF